MTRHLLIADYLRYYLHTERNSGSALPDGQSSGHRYFHHYPTWKRKEKKYCYRMELKDHKRLQMFTRRETNSFS